MAKIIRVRPHRPTWSPGLCIGGILLYISWELGWLNAWTLVGLVLVAGIIDYIGGAWKNEVHIDRD